MTQEELLTQLLQKLNEPQATYAELNRYYQGMQALSFLAPEARAALSNRFGRIATNLPRLAVTALTERLRVTGFAGVDVWDDWLRNDMDELSAVAIREALLLGQSFLTVWADPYGRPTISVESATQMACLRDPGTRTLTAAIKRWEDDRYTHAVVYLPDEIVRLRADQKGAVVHGSFTVVESLANPLGRVPVVRLLNSDRILDEGVSEIADLTTLADAMNKLLADLMVASEYTGRPRRFATGVELVEEPVTVVDPETGLTVPVLDVDGQPVLVESNPIPEGHRAMISEAADAKFGQLPAADMTGYSNAVDILLTQISACSALPPHYLGIMHDNPSSADALRASEAGLTARAQARQKQFGRSFEDLARLVVAVRDGADPNLVDVRVAWADAATRSVAQEADAVVKLFQAGLLPQHYALAKLGYSDDEISAITTTRRAGSRAAVVLS